MRRLATSADRRYPARGGSIRRILTLLGVLLAALALLVVLLFANWARKPSRQVTVEPAPVAIDGRAVAEVLAEAVRLPTISADVTGPDAASLEALHRLLIERYPRAHAALERRVVAGHSLLYTWRGSDPSLPPALLMAHLDVVPIDDADSWSHPAFAGHLEGDVLYGRGTLDDKQSVVMQLAAVEHLLARGFAPRRTTYLAFGHDEEVGGTGAAAIARLLREQGIRLHVVLDEGGVVMDDVFDGLDAPAALVGISEKGYASVEIVAHDTGGHSSMPPDSTAAGQIAAAVVALEASPRPASLDGPTGAMMDHLGPELSLPMGLVMGNRWLLGPVIERIMAGKPKTNATLRTTTAVTMLEGSIKDNVLPQSARAVVNFRIAPGDSVAGVLQHVRDTVGPQLQVTLLDGIGSEPSPVSRIDGPPWHALATTVRQTWPDAVVAPYLVLGATDARHFADLSEAVYRFAPVRLTSEDLDGIHGTDEHISVQNLTDGTAFYVRLVRTLSEAPSP